MQKHIEMAQEKPGQIHQELGVPEGEDIPLGKLIAAAKGKGAGAARARKALALRRKLEGKPKDLDDAMSRGLKEGEPGEEAGETPAEQAAETAAGIE